MNINYEYYRIFYYAAKYRNLTQAAEILCSNQPNVSRTIKLLEHELGVTLLVRSNRGITLTPEGERLYRHVKVAVEQIQSAEEELLRSRTLQEGVVSIGASEAALHLLLLPALNRFKKQFPQIRIRITNNLTNLALDAVKNALVDFAVVTAPVTIEKPLVSLPIMDFQDVLLGGPSYSFLASSPISLKELTNYPLVCLGEHTITYDFYSRFYRSHHQVLKPELEAASTDQLLPMIKSDLGIGFVPEIFAKEPLEKGEVCQIPLRETLPRRSVCFVWNESQPLSVAATELKKLLME